MRLEAVQAETAKAHSNLKQNIECVALFTGNLCYEGNGTKAFLLPS